MTYTAFKKIVWSFYKSHGRSLPWRTTHDPYKIFISELMLQQTQVERVKEKYAAWMKELPTWQKLAEADFKKVLSLWSGLDYNRRAKFAHEAAKIISKNFKNKLPKDFNELIKIPGIGTYTAGAISAFAFNIPLVLIETNVRTVFIHHFFKDQKNISDTDILPLIKKTLDMENPREWYWALMDYGSHLKKTIGNKNVQSKHYLKQSKFKGSDREIRGKILRILLEKNHTASALQKITGAEKERLAKILTQMVDEKIIKKSKNSYKIA